MQRCMGQPNKTIDTTLLRCDKPSGRIHGVVRLMVLLWRLFSRPEFVPARGTTRDHSGMYGAEYNENE